MVSFSLWVTRVVRAHDTPQLSSRIARKGRAVLARIAKVAVGVIAILTQAIVTTRDGGQTRPWDRQLGPEGPQTPGYRPSINKTLQPAGATLQKPVSRIYTYVKPWVNQ